MRMTKARALPLLLISVLALSACSADGQDGPTPSASPSASAPSTSPEPSESPETEDAKPFGIQGDGAEITADGTARLAAAKESFESAAGFTLQGSAESSGGALSWEMTASGDGSDWTGTVYLPQQELRVRHTEATTWVSASEEYWTLFGLPEELAKRAGEPDQFVVFPRDVPVATVSFVDVSTLVQAIKMLDPATASHTHDAADGTVVFTVEAADQTTWLQTSANPTPRLEGLASRAAGSLNAVVITYLDSAPTIELPSSDRVIIAPKP